jgi:hypothetical protein
MATSYLKSINILVATQFLTLFLKTYLTQWMGFITKKKKTKKQKPSPAHTLSPKDTYTKKNLDPFSRSLAANYQSTLKPHKTTLKQPHLDLVHSLRPFPFHFDFSRNRSLTSLSFSFTPSTSLNQDNNLHFVFEVLYC